MGFQFQEINSNPESVTRVTGAICAILKLDAREYVELVIIFAYFTQHPNVFNTDLSCFGVFVTGWPESCGVDRCCPGRVVDEKNTQ